ncbi:MAG: PHP domain-containing protein [Armatimonadota bacterium]
MTESVFEVPGQWLKGNLHLHTTVSDGELTPQQAVDAYREQGYDFLSITDHDRVVDVDELDGGGMTLLPGIEIPAPGAELGQSIHVVGIGVSAEPGQVEGDKTQWAIDRLRGLSELCFVAHPSWSSLTWADILPLEGPIGLEVFNTTCRRGVGRGTSEVQWDDCLARGARYLGLAVDDAHCHYDDRYGGWVMLRAAEPTPQAIYAALRAGHFYSSSGPTIQQVAIDGDTVHVECSPCLEVFAVCPMPGRGTTNWRRGGGREAGTAFDLPLRTNADPIRIVVIDEAGRRAWTNPFWPE